MGTSGSSFVCLFFGDRVSLCLIVVFYLLPDYGIDHKADGKCYYFFFFIISGFILYNKLPFTVSSTCTCYFFILVYYVYVCGSLYYTCVCQKSPFSFYCWTKVWGDPHSSFGEQCRSRHLMQPSRRLYSGSS